MSTTESTLDHCTVGPHDGVQTTVAELSEGDLVVVNDTRRTWEVTDVVDQSDREDAQHRRVLRLRASASGDPDIAGLVSTVHSNHHDCRFEILHTDYWYLEDHTESVEAIEHLETTSEWVVASRSGDGVVYHLPDPIAVCRGDARPACHETAAAYSNSEWRIVVRHLLQEVQRPCKECFRRHRPRVCERVQCPDCDRLITTPFFQGSHPELVEALVVDCPADDCEFSGAVSL
mgnify:CR=1 FL=1